MTFDAQVIFRHATLRTDPKVLPGNGVGRLLMWTIVKAHRIVVEQAGRKEWLELATPYEGLYANYLYPNLAGQVKVRMQIPPLETAYGYMLHDFEYYKKPVHRLGRNDPRYYDPKFRPDKRGVPSVHKLSGVRVELTPRLQWLWYELLQKVEPSMSSADLKRIYARLIRSDGSHTNFAGPDRGYADYVNEVNTEAKGCGYECIGCTGNVYQLIGPKYKVGALRVEYYNVRTIDSEAFNENEILEYPIPNPVVMIGTVSLREPLPGGRFKIGSYGHLPHGVVPIPLISRGGLARVRADLIRVLRPGESPPNPFVLE